LIVNTHGSFDLWEEVSSSSFFTTSVQYRALVEGAKLATSLGQTSAAAIYKAEAAKVLCFLQVRTGHICLNFILLRI